MNDEIERLEGITLALTNEISHFRGSGALSANEQLRQGKLVSELLARTEGLQVMYRKNYEGVLRTVEMLKDSIMDIFNKVRLMPSSMASAHGRHRRPAHHPGDLQHISHPQHFNHRCILHAIGMEWLSAGFVPLLTYSS